MSSAWPRRRPEPAGRGTAGSGRVADDGGVEQCAPEGAHLLDRSAPVGAHLLDRSAPEGAHLPSSGEGESSEAEAGKDVNEQRGRRGSHLALPRSWDKSEAEPLSAAQLRIKG